MPQISAIGKYLDQPLLTAKINKSIPKILTIGSGFVLAHEIHKAPRGKRTKRGIQRGSVLAATVISAINAPIIAAYLTGRKSGLKLGQIVANNTKIVDTYLKNNKVGDNVKKILEKSKENILSLKEVHTLFTDKGLEKVSNELIPPPNNISSKDIFREIGWLSIYGAVPVAGGITGGIIGDRLTNKNWKEKVPNKLKEGAYQYLANIFLCNIGAGAALGILEKLNIKSKTARCLGMVGGILLTGVIGGSVIANYIGKKVINPLVSRNKKVENDIRTPELLDLSLHTDDIATISLLSGLKWIEPSLPILYSVSGYRAGIGYRNHQKHEKVKNVSKNLC